MSCCAFRVKSLRVLVVHFPKDPTRSPRMLCGFAWNSTNPLPDFSGNTGDSYQQRATNQARPYSEFTAGQFYDNRPWPLILDELREPLRKVVILAVNISFLCVSRCPHPRMRNALKHIQGCPNLNSSVPSRLRRHGQRNSLPGRELATYRLQSPESLLDAA